MPYIQRESAKINFEVWGEQGEWVTLVNGHTRPLNDFRMLGNHLVSKGLRCLALDNRGAGLTEYTGAFAMKDLVADIEALWSHIGIQETHLLGISMGGIIAQKCAYANPSKINKLVLISTAPSRQYIETDEVPWGSTMESVTLRLAKYFTEEFAAKNKPVVLGMVKQILKNIERGDFIKQSEDQMNAVKGFDALDLLPGINCPSLIIHGELDEVISLDAAKSIYTNLPQSEIEIVEGVGHLLLAEAPKALYKLVGDFLTIQRAITKVD